MSDEREPFERFCSHPLQERPTQHLIHPETRQPVCVKHWWCAVCERGIVFSWEPPPERCP